LRSDNGTRTAGDGIGVNGPHDKPPTDTDLARQFGLADVGTILLGRRGDRTETFFCFVLEIESEKTDGGGALPALDTLFASPKKTTAVLLEIRWAGAACTSITGSEPS
jgi:hypothetical protein